MQRMLTREILDSHRMSCKPNQIIHIVYDGIRWDVMFHRQQEEEVKTWYQTEIWSIWRTLGAAVGEAVNSFRIQYGTIQY